MLLTAAINVLLRSPHLDLHEPCAGVYLKQNNKTQQDTEGTTPMRMLYKSVVGTARACYMYMARLVTVHDDCLILMIEDDVYIVGTLAPLL